MDSARDAPDYTTMRLQLSVPGNTPSDPALPEPSTPHPPPPYYTANLELNTVDGGVAEAAEEHGCGRTLHACVSGSMKRILLRIAAAVVVAVIITIILAIEKLLNTNLIDVNEIVQVLKTEVNGFAGGSALPSMTAKSA